MIFIFLQVGRLEPLENGCERETYVTNKVSNLELLYCSFDIFSKLQEVALLRHLNFDRYIKSTV